jgi:hypothetical protein
MSNGINAEYKRQLLFVDEPPTMAKADIAEITSF